MQTTKIHYTHTTSAQIANHLSSAGSLRRDGLLEASKLQLRQAHALRTGEFAIHTPFIVTASPTRQVIIL